MTTENETFSETLSDEELAAQIDGAEEEEVGPEKVEDSIINAIIELENEAEANQNVQGDEGKELDKPAISASEAAAILAKSKGKKGGKRQTYEGSELAGGQQTEAPPERLNAPQAWDTEAKEQFQKLPDLAKKESLAFWKRLDKHFTEGSRGIAEARQRYGHLEQVVERYLPHLHDRGITDPAQAVAAVLALDLETVQNPLAALDKALRRNGITPEDLYRYRQSGGEQTQQQQFQQSPQQTPLTRDEVARIIQEESQNSYQQQSVQTDAQALEQIRHEVGPDGRYKYPELWDSQGLNSNYWSLSTLERVKPLVESLRKTQHGISVAEATRRAISTLRLLDGNTGSQYPNPGTRLNTDQETIQRAKAANVSIRGRGNGTVPTTTTAKRGETVEESLQRAIAELSNGRY